MEPSERPLSVVIVTYASAAEIGPTLDALGAQLRAGDEVVVVDNASRDATLAVVAEHAPDAVLVREARNIGFAAGVNRGVAAATGDVVVLLNPDAVPAAGWRDAITAPTRWGAWMGLVTAEHGRVVNTNGGVVHFTGLAWSGEAGAPSPGSARGPREAGFASGACLALTRETWVGLGGFPEEFFMYHEDVDLSLRLRLTGATVGVEPAARVDHAYDFAKGAAKWRRLEANRLATVLRTYPTRLLLAVAPALVVLELALLPASAAGGWLPQKLGAWADVLRAVPRLRRERRTIQATRTVTARAFADGLVAELSSPYLGALGRSPLLAAALRVYWRAARALL